MARSKPDADADDVETEQGDSPRLVGGWCRRDGPHIVAHLAGGVEVQISSNVTPLSTEQVQALTKLLAGLT